MKFTKFAFAAIVALSAIGASAQVAASKVSAEVGYSTLDFKSGNYTAHPSIARAVVAYDVNDNLAIEGMAGMNASSSDVQVGALTINAQVDSVYGVFVKPKAKLTQDLEVYGRLGYTNTTLKASAAGVSASSTKDSGAYGVGLSYHITPAVYLSTDYTSYYEQSGDSVQGWTVGVGYKF